jgi:Arc/MetJ-type ribon-helix-helix transcriptional regulator
MSTQIAVRLPDTLVVALDGLVAAGRARSRASLVEAALERELRRLAAVSDAEILHQVGPADDLDGLVGWASGRFGVEE